jgi:hypothetical protein
MARAILRASPLSPALGRVMETDGPLKLLFRTCARELLPLTGDAGAVVLGAGPEELQALQRRADCVLRLERNGEAYYRHLEFEDKPDPAMARRCFEYNTQLILQHKVPVLTTVIYIQPPRPKGPLTFRVELNGHEINRWRFEQICLWEMDAQESLHSAAKGTCPLVPLMRGGQDLRVIRDALDRIAETFPPELRAVAEEVLLALAGQYYTYSKLVDLVGRERMAQLNLYKEAVAEGRTEGRIQGEIQGRIQGERAACAALARKYHAAVFDRVAPIIAACPDLDRLEQWMLSAPDMSDDEFLKLLNG